MLEKRLTYSRFMIHWKVGRMSLSKEQRRTRLEKNLITVDIISSVKVKNLVMDKDGGQRPQKMIRQHDNISVH